MPSAMERIGTEPIGKLLVLRENQGEAVDLHPSDHYGLRVSLQFLKDGAKYTQNGRGTQSPDQGGTSTNTNAEENELPQDEVKGKEDLPAEMNAPVADKCSQQRTDPFATRIEDYLRSKGQVMSVEEHERRQRTLDELNELCRRCVYAPLPTGSTPENHPVESTMPVARVLFVLGSTLLGVDGPSSDIDALCIGPSYISHTQVRGPYI